MTTHATEKQREPGIVTGLFEDRESAESVYNSLRSHGIHGRRDQRHYVRRDTRQIFSHASVGNKGG